MRLGDDCVDRRNDEQRERGADDHAAHQRDADAVARAGARTMREDQRQVPEHRGRRGHQNRPQSCGRGLGDRARLVEPGALQLVRELDDQDAVLGHQPDECDQTHLAVDVDRGEAQEREHQSAGERERRRARHDHDRIAEALELRGEHKADQDGREQEHTEELAAFGAQLPRLTGIVERVAARHDLARLGLEERQRLIERHRGRNDRLDAHRIQLLEAFELAWLGRGLERGERRQRHQLALGPGHIDRLQLFRREPLAALDLRDHLVAAALDAEPVDEVATDQRRQIAPGLAHVDPERTHLVTVEHHLGLRLVEFEIGVHVDEHPALVRLLHQLIRDVEQLLRLGRRGDHEIHGEAATAGQRGRRH